MGQLTIKTGKHFPTKIQTQYFLQILFKNKVLHKSVARRIAFLKIIRQTLEAIETSKRFTYNIFVLALQF